jgi:hypothetical protein
MKACEVFHKFSVQASAELEDDDDCSVDSSGRTKWGRRVDELVEAYLLKETGMTAAQISHNHLKRIQDKIRPSGAGYLVTLAGHDGRYGVISNRVLPECQPNEIEKLAGTVCELGTIHDDTAPIVRVT